MRNSDFEDHLDAGGVSKRVTAEPDGESRFSHNLQADSSLLVFHMSTSRNTVHRNPRTNGNSSSSGVVCLVTGGTGLVGRALQWAIANEPVGSRYGKQSEDEEWIFLSSKDGDLR